MWDRIKGTLADNFLMTVVIFVILAAWVYNSLVVPKFAIRDLDALLAAVVSQHGVNNWLGSGRGVPYTTMFTRGGATNATSNTGGHPDAG